VRGVGPIGSAPSPLGINSSLINSACLPSVSATFRPSSVSA